MEKPKEFYIIVLIIISISLSSAIFDRPSLNDYHQLFYPLESSRELVNGTFNLTVGVGNPLYQNDTAKIGYALETTEDMVNITFNRAVDLIVKRNTTVSFWMSIHDADDSDKVFGQASNVSASSRWSAQYRTATDSLTLNDLIVGCCDKVYIDFDTWFMVTLRTNTSGSTGSKVSSGCLFINDTEIGCGSLTYPANNTGDFVLGERGWGVGSSMVNNASYDEFHAWGRALSDSEIQTLFNNFNPQNYNETVIPNVTINTPTNSTFTTTTIRFNVTAIDTTAMDDCYYSLNYGNKNISMSNLSTNNQVWTDENTTMKQGTSIAHFYCNDTYNRRNITENVTFFIDSILPEVEINTTNASSVYGQTFNFDYNISDTHKLRNCFFTLRDSAGSVHNFAENSSLNCTGTRKTLSTLTFDTFTVTIYGNDTLGNQNFSILTFTTAPTPTTPPGGGGGGGINQVSKIAIIQPENITEQDGLKRAILFSRIFEKCGNSASKIGSCILNQIQKEELIELLFEQIVELNIEELDKWVSNFNKEQFEEVLVSVSNADKYDLFVGVLSALEFKITPFRLDPFYTFIISSSPKLIYSIKSNRKLSEVELVEGELGMNVIITTNTTAQVILEPVNLDFSSKVFKGTASYTDEEGNTVFQEINLRIINLRDKTTLIFIGFGASILFLSIIYRKRINKLFKKVLKR